jgi:hypothetical protein
MKKIFSLIRLLTLLSFIATPIFAAGGNNAKITLDKVYRTDIISDSYHFLLLASNGSYYHVHTNKTKTLTVSEIKSSSILNILKKKQSWGEAFASKGEYVTKNHKLYTKRYFDLIKVESSKKVKYLNKIFHLQ